MEYIFGKVAALNIANFLRAASFTEQLHWNFVKFFKTQQIFSNQIFAGLFLTFLFSIYWSKFLSIAMLDITCRHGYYNLMDF